MKGPIVAAALLFLAAGCRKVEVASAPPDAGAAPAPQAKNAKTENDSLFIFASPRVRDSALPARFSAALPTKEVDLQTPQRFPPAPMVSAALAAGDPAMEEKLLAAVSAAASAGTVPEPLAQYYVELFGYRPTPVSCEWIQSVATGKPPERVRAVFFGALVRCGPSVGKAFARDDAPDEAVIDWYFEQHDAEALLAFNPRVVKAAAALAPSADEYEVRKIGFAFARMAGSTAALGRLQLQLKDPKRRALVALGMLRSPTPEGKSFGRQACQTLKTDPMCSGGDAEPSRTAVRPIRVEDALEQEDWSEVRKRFPAEAVKAALLKCTRDGETDSDRARCLTRLAAVDRAQAVALARELRVRPASASPSGLWGGSSWLSDAVRALKAFPEEGALEKRLGQLGFTPATEAADRTEDDPDVTVEGALTKLGRTSSFDVETGMFPNAHDGLLAELALLAAPELDGVVFEEVPPPESRMDEGPYTLRAYANGKRYEVQAQNLGDWYDLDAVLGLLNALLRARGSEWRYTTLPTGDQTATVLAGPQAAIRALAKDKLIAIGSASASMESGKEAEESVSEMLQKNGGDVRKLEGGGADFVEE